MSKRRWMRSVTEAAGNEAPMPWARGERRARWKAAARARALAA